jgi:2-C-methyl-D-erythritol 4-phosphate cytidylyltransferase
MMESNSGHAAGILLAGGRGSRARLSTNKAYVDVKNAPMISHSLKTLDRSRWVTELVLVIRPQDRKLAEDVVAESGLTTPLTMVGGGESRHGSEIRGLEALSERICDGSLDLVAIHDGARPYLRSSLLDELCENAHRHGGAVPVVPIRSPLYRLVDNCDLAILEQNRLHRAQTPQVFSALRLLEAYRRAREAGFEGVDTAETAQRFSNLRIRAVPGDPSNMKLTFPQDFQSPQL